jgi:hypothetical protein
LMGPSVLVVVVLVTLIVDVGWCSCWLDDGGGGVVVVDKNAASLFALICFAIVGGGVISSFIVSFVGGCGTTSGGITESGTLLSTTLEDVDKNEDNLLVIGFWSAIDETGLSLTDANDGDFSLLVGNGVEESVVVVVGVLVDLSATPNKTLVGDGSVSDLIDSSFVVGGVITSLVVVEIGGWSSLVELGWVDECVTTGEGDEFKNNASLLVVVVDFVAGGGCGVVVLELLTFGGEAIVLDVDLSRVIEDDVGLSLIEANAGDFCAPPPAPPSGVVVEADEVILELDVVLLCDEVDLSATPNKTFEDDSVFLLFDDDSGSTFVVVDSFLEIGVAVIVDVVDSIVVAVVGMEDGSTVVVLLDAVLLLLLLAVGVVELAFLPSLLPRIDP